MPALIILKWECQFTKQAGVADAMKNRKNTVALIINISEWRIQKF